jgi:hypothetical protein
LITAGRADAELAAWRDVAEAGGLPSPDQDRWQPLRSGVVNLWEFDVAEYWLAGGRAQFVGQNQSGKSTLMALTTLILLAGDLDRQLVDTFGQQHKAFRYYVEPTDDPQDRRDTGASTSRGWAWAEYGRLDGDGQPQYLTCLLYAQAKRGANDFVRTWAVCEGRARVRAGLDLCQVPPSDRRPSWSRRQDSASRAMAPSTSRGSAGTCSDSPSRPGLRRSCAFSRCCGPRT